MSAAASLRAVLDRAFTPRTIAVIGASAQPEKFGYKLVEHLVKGGFPGRIYPVNPRSMPILGLPTYPALAEMPGPVDVAALLVPAEATPAAVSECAAKGVSVAVIITSGFAEASPAGAQAQAGMSAVARAAGMRIVGPNCEGLVNLQGGLVLSFSFTGMMITRPAAMGECLAAVLDDPTIDAVAFVLTAVGDPEFAGQVPRMSASPKPVVICWTAGQALAGAALEYFTEHRIPIFESTPRLVSALGALRAYWGFRLGPAFRAGGER
ncbi:MAG: CoA-binding protein [Candidatus Rokubacteria bacterium]|nr:CoA-binding protein [Candidatus Rokubacteria bacterium]